MRDRTMNALLVAALLTVAAPHPGHGQYAARSLTASASHPTPRMSALDVDLPPLGRGPYAGGASAVSTRRYVLIGAGIGAAVGVTIGAISVHNHPPTGSYSPSSGTTVVGLGVLGAITGALVGWLVSRAAP